MNSLPRWLISITDMPEPCQASISEAACARTSSGRTAGPALKLKPRVTGRRTRRSTSERPAQAERKGAAVVSDGVPLDLGVLRALVSVFSDQADRSAEQFPARAADELPAENGVAAGIVGAGGKARVPVFDIDLHYSRAGADIGVETILRDGDVVQRAQHRAAGGDALVPEDAGQNDAGIPVGGGVVEPEIHRTDEIGEADAEAAGNTRVQRRLGAVEGDTRARRHAHAQLDVRMRKTHRRRPCRFAQRARARNHDRSPRFHAVTPALASNSLIAVARFLLPLPSRPPAPRPRAWCLRPSRSSARPASSGPFRGSA